MSSESGSGFRIFLLGSVKAVWSSLRRLGTLLIPLSLFVGLAAAIAFSPSSVFWATYPTVQALPYVVYAVSFVLGAFFIQSRVSFMSVLLAMVTLVLDRAFFVRPVPGHGEIVVFLASVYIAPLMTLFYHLSERGIMTTYGLVRIVIVLSAIIVLIVVPRIDYFAEAAVDMESLFWGPISEQVPVSLFGLACFLCCAPFLLIRNKQESPLLGRNLACVLLFVFAALNCHSTLWSIDKARAVLLTFMAGAGFTLMWAVLESSWRHANIDELTELPGRRTLKHHMARLGSTYAMAVLDVDFFKKINDRYGHDTGDQVLRFIAARLKRFTAGRAYRYGGEEFVLVFEGDQSDVAVDTAEEIRKSIEDSKFIVRAPNRPRKRPAESSESGGQTVDYKDRRIGITVSLGVATSRNYSSPHDVLQAADKALYRAKKDGRNCVKYSR